MVSGVYLELMGHRDGARSLNVKAYAPPGMAVELQHALRKEAGFPDGRRVGKRAKTCTVSKHALKDRPQGAAKHAQDLEGLIGLVAPAAFARTFAQPMPGLGRPGPPTFTGIRDAPGS